MQRRKFFTVLLAPVLAPFIPTLLTDEQKHPMLTVQMDKTQLYTFGWRGWTRLTNIEVPDGY